MTEELNIFRTKHVLLGFLRGSQFLTDENNRGAANSANSADKRDTSHKQCSGGWRERPKATASEIGDRGRFAPIAEEEGTTV